MPKFGPIRVVCVEWDDSMEHSGWDYDVEETLADMGMCRQFTVGILVGEDKRNLFMARDFTGRSQGPEGFRASGGGGLFKITKGCVVKVHHIKDLSLSYNADRNIIKSPKFGGKR
jgi:hypothetical protein